MLARLLKGMDGRARLPFANSKTTTQSTLPTPGPNPRSKPACQNTGPKRGPKPVRIARLYPERPTEASMHAGALLRLIREECPDLVSLYVPKSDLERTYRELCAAESWEAHHWTAIARQLASLTKKREVKRAGVRFVAYQIPPAKFR